MYLQTRLEGNKSNVCLRTSLSYGLSLTVHLLDGHFMLLNKNLPAFSLRVDMRLWKTKHPRKRWEDNAFFRVTERALSSFPGWEEERGPWERGCFIRYWCFTPSFKLLFRFVLVNLHLWFLELGALFLLYTYFVRLANHEDPL